MRRKIKGRFCRRIVAPKASFDRRSFRWKQSGSSWVLVGCPKGKWNAKAARCLVGTRAHEVLAKSNGRCAVGRVVKKGGLGSPRVGKVVSFAKILPGERFRLTLDGRHGWLVLRKKDPNLAPGDYVKIDATTYRSDNGRTLVAPRGFAVEYLGAEKT